MKPVTVPRLIALACLAVPVAGADFSQVQTILASSCIECHGGAHAKGGLKLDTPDNIMKGGKNGPAVVPGFPSDSPMYTRVILGADDPDVMPAKGDHLTDAQCATILAWIKAGAQTGGGSDAAPAPAAPAAPPAPASTATDPTMAGKADPMKPDAPAMTDPNAIMNPVVPPGAPGGTIAKAAPAPSTAKFVAPDTDLDVLAQGIPAPDQKALDALKASNIWYRTLSKNGSLIELDCREITAPAAARLRGLSRLAANVCWLNLAGTPVADADLGLLKGFTHLQRLHLERTAIGDPGMTSVAGFTELTYLNLYGTKITDTGLADLSSLTKLTELYVRGTGATPAGGDALKKSLPDLTITFDEDLPAPAAPGSGKKKGKGKKAN